MIDKEGLRQAIIIAVLMALASFAGVGVACLLTGKFP